MAPSASLRELPQVPGGDRAAGLPDRAEAHVQVVLREERLALRDLPDPVDGAHGTQAAALPDLGGASGAVREEHAAVPSVLRVRCGVEEVAPEEDGEREDERMAGTEQMDRLRGVQTLLRCENDPDEIAEPIRFEERHDAAEHMGLERAGVRHDRPRELEDGVDAIPQDRLPPGTLAQDVRVRDQDLRAE